MDYTDMKETLEQSIPNKKYIHSLSVSDTAVELAKRYNVSIEKARIAGLLHDCARELPISAMLEQAKKHHIDINSIEMHQPILLHASLGAIIAQEKYGIYDNDILNAIKAHTTGKAKMTDLDKIIYLADMVEPNRTKYNGLAELRNSIKTEPLDSVMIMAFDISIAFIIQKQQMIHTETVLARNFLIAQKMHHE